jgi:hypothetical protein
LNIKYDSKLLRSVTILIVRIIQRDTIVLYVEFHVKYPLFLSDFNPTSIFLDRFFKNTQMSNFSPVGALLLYADGRTDVTKLIFAFHNFSYAPNQETCFSHCASFVHYMIKRQIMEVMTFSVASQCF